MVMSLDGCRKKNIDVMGQEVRAKCSQPRRRADHCIKEQVVSRRMIPTSTADKAPGPNQLKRYAVPGRAMLDCLPVPSVGSDRRRPSW